ncbi:YraN family protein [Idiomarina tyrosinivorans]|uniref:UPF0102 protein CWI84_07270 n=1 Tax=Idiomarina tyrosinivorans TaxID=1445662 RepID=A0A432ZQD6_9GAMM|nr:YraN family protein [Idiomarina tyrosinivorans]RUO80093.1 YraN family protein [Idiomarina tyrosinivorans]
MHNKKRGNLGEQRACQLLQSQAIRIVERNFRTPRGEIDIIARDEDTWVFIEVKFRQDADFAEVLSQISHAQLARIKTAARYYLLNKRIAEHLCHIRFDVITVTVEPEHIEWFKDAF